MKARELRIGNYVTKKGKTRPCQIKGIYYDNGYGLDNGYSYSLEEISPIELTDEWFEKFGFEYTQHQGGVEYIGKNGFSIYFHPEFKEEVGGSASRNFGGISVYINYVHELQNLVYVLTGIELTQPGK